MSSKNTKSESEAKFDEILGKAFRHRGKHRIKYVAALKQLFMDQINLPPREEERSLDEEIRKLNTKLQRTEAKLKLTNQSWKITQEFYQKSDRKIEKLEKELKETSATLREKEQTFKTIQFLLKL
jgi:septal ring factor EnvC (AmiA/AmiB activator)